MVNTIVLYPLLRENSWYERTGGRKEQNKECEMKQLLFLSFKRVILADNEVHFGA